MATNLSSETPYLQVQNILDDELHVSELILKHVWQIIKPIKSQNANLLRELDIMRHEVENAHEKTG